MKKMIGILGLVALSFATSCTVLSLTNADAASKRKRYAKQTAAPLDVVVPPRDFCTPGFFSLANNAWKVGPRYPNLWWLNYTYNLNCLSTGDAGCAYMDQMWLWQQNPDLSWTVIAYWYQYNSAGCGQTTSANGIMVKATLTPGVKYYLQGVSTDIETGVNLAGSPGYYWTAN